MSDFTTSATFRYVVNVLYVKDGTGGCRIETEQSAFVRPGDVVEAAGFPAVTPGRPILRNALLQRCRVGQRDRRRYVAVAEDNVLTPDHDAETCADERAAAQRAPADDRERSSCSASGDTVFDAGLDIDSGERTLDKIRAGQPAVGHRGVFLPGRTAASFRLFLRSPDDVRVLAPAPWWTMRHTAVMAVILALARAAAHCGCARSPP